LKVFHFNMAAVVEVTVVDGAMVVAIRREGNDV
jgi:hypothetical protein